MAVLPNFLNLFKLRGQTLLEMDCFLFIILLRILTKLVLDLIFDWEVELFLENLLFKVMHPEHDCK